MRPLDVLHEDERFLAVLKPAGIPVHGGAAVKVAPVMKRLGPGVFPVHRLDAGTSGVLLLAKSPQAARLAADHWAEADKRYLAVTVGVPESGRIDAPLDDGGRLRPAATRIQLLRRFPRSRWGLVEARIETGRTHQIRRHLADRGHPVVMDDRYGDFAANKQFRAQVRSAGAPNPKHPLLHAQGLRLLDLDLLAPTPERWQLWLDAIGGPVERGTDGAG